MKDARKERIKLLNAEIRKVEQQLKATNLQNLRSLLAELKDEVFILKRNKHSSKFYEFKESSGKRLIF